MQKSAAERRSTNYHNEHITPKCNPNTHLYGNLIPSLFFAIYFQVLNFDSPRGGISLETEKTRTGTSSKLLVTKATKADSGSYTCDPSRGQPKTADVHIITGLYNYKIFTPQKKYVYMHCFPQT